MPLSLKATFTIEMKAKILQATHLHPNNAQHWILISMLSPVMGQDIYDVG